MCEFCTRHGEGKKWYLQASNYAADLLSDASRRRTIADLFDDPQHLKRDEERLVQLHRAPRFVQQVIKNLVVRRMKKWHFGQVVPLEEVEQIFGFVNSIVRVACVCRYATLGREARYCYGVSMGPGGGVAGVLRGLDGSFFSGPDTSGFERLSAQQALAALAEHEQEGLCHTVWTFKTPFIGGICNCDRADCMAMRSTITHGVQVMFRAEYVAAVEADLCVGCRSCLRACQFGALAFSAATKKAYVDQMACYGCGICRSMCSKGALSLLPRAQVPAVASVW